MSNNVRAVEIYNANNGSYPNSGSDINNGKGLANSGSNTSSYYTNPTNSAYCISSVGSDGITYAADNAHQTPIVGTCAGTDNVVASEPVDPAVAGLMQPTVCTVNTYSVGSTGPGDGTVFYDKGSCSNGWRYLEYAPQGWYTATAPSDPKAEYGCYGTDISGAAGITYGTGKQNTIDIILAKCQPDIAGNLISAKVASQYTGGGMNDWFLPSVNELDQMYTYNMTLWETGANRVYHCSSSETSATQASMVRFFRTGPDGYHVVSPFAKNEVGSYICAVRPIRQF